MTFRLRALFSIAALAVAAPTSAQELRVTEFQGISLLGDTLRRPRLDSATQARVQADHAAARIEWAAKPNDPDALIWVGRRLAYMGRYMEAIDIFSEGVRRFPNDARMYRHRGHRYIPPRQLDKAIPDLERAARLMAGKP